MNGNYVYLRQVAKDKQYAFINEAREYRLAEQAGRPTGHQRAATFFVRAGNQLRSAVNRVGRRSSDYVASWKAGLQKPGAATS